MTPKVLHVSTTHTGGAGIAARELNQVLNLHSWPSLFVARKHETFSLSDFEQYLTPSIVEQVGSKSVTAANLLLGDPFFSLFSVGVRDVLRYTSVGNQVLHFHNFFNVVNREFILRRLGPLTPRIVTLHDERFYTGGCHHALSCDGFESGCSACPRLSKLIHFSLDKVAEGLQNDLGELKMAVIAPSIWILDRFRRSPFAFIPSFFIPNVLNWYEVPFLKRRETPVQIRIGFAGGNSALKGQTLWNELPGVFGQNSRFEFLTPEHFSFHMNVFWQNIDVLVVPSIVDNHPNVISEAHLRGIPVVASNVGGISEMATAGYDEVVYEVQNVEAWRDSILSVVENYSSMMAQRVRLLTIGNMERALVNHIDVYKRLLTPS